MSDFYYRSDVGRVERETPVAEPSAVPEAEFLPADSADPDEEHRGAVAATDRAAQFLQVELNAIEARVLGSLIEKSFLTPDVYPMTTNGLVTACNQKTNRDPVMALTPVDIDGALLAMRQRNLVRRVHTPGSRSTKHRQTLDEALSLNDQHLALLSVLLLRGPQTIGELRLRTERHDVGFDDLEAVEALLERLSERTTPLVTQLARQPGHKEARWQHLMGEPGSADIDHPGDDRDDPVSPAPAESAIAPAEPPFGQAPQGSRLAARVDELETEVATLRRQLAALAGKLGEPLE